jgi:hypothetical protein
MINAFVLSIKGRIDKTGKAEGSKPWQFNRVPALNFRFNKPIMVEKRSNQRFDCLYMSEKYAAY